ncbi:multidrug effflux MFS transporter [Comamonas nitrativorans]|uniref:Bcr/CflA family efflux transporter n=1 Tax=Comamonas nitrativorans TaxID=108437 RepID=A0ABV9GZF7_9BURK
MPVPTASAPAARTARAAITIVVLAALLSLQPVTTDVYLPALPALTQALGSTVAAGQLTLSALLLAFGCSQLVWGPLSDRFGRRPILLCGIVLYALASVGSVAAASMDWLILWRTVQGAAMGAVVMCARAIVRDLYDPVAGARAMSKALTGLGVVACLCAPVGGLLAQMLGWRAPLAAVTVYALACLLLVWRYLPETLARPNPRALQPGTLVRTWSLVLRHPTFWSYSLLTTASYGGLFTYLATSSFIFIGVLGLSRTHYGWVLFTSGLAYFLGTFLCRALMARWGLQRTVAIGGLLSITGGTLLAGAAFLGWHHPLALLCPFYIFALGHGIHQPCGQTGCVAPFPQAAGVASAFNGFMMMLLAFAIGLWLGQQSNNTIWPLVYGVWGCSIALAIVAWWPVQKFAPSS